MTIRRQTWLADALAGSVLLVALYLILLEFSTRGFRRISSLHPHVLGFPQTWLGLISSSP